MHHIEAYDNKNKPIVKINTLCNELCGIKKLVKYDSTIRKKIPNKPN